jgi:hypothetical protein
MLRLKHLSNKYQKRLIRPEYAHTQATPYAVTLDDSFRDDDGSILLPLSGDNDGVQNGPAGFATRTAAAHTTKNSLTAGLVAVRTEGEKITIATGANVAEQPFGLLANFVGGDLDDVGDENQVGVWRGPDSTFTLLAPAFNDTGLAAAYAAADAGTPVLLYAGADGRLACTAGLVGAAVGNKVAVARLIDRPSASRITVDLIV